MKKQIISLFLTSLVSFSAIAAENLDLGVLNSEKIDNPNGFTEVVQLIPQEEKKRVIQEKIEFLKKDIAKWKAYQAELIQMKTEYENAYKLNEDKIKQYNKDIEDIKLKMEQSEKDISESSNDIDIGVKILADTSIKDEIVEFNLPNGKKIKLIKHTVFPGESLSKIIGKTFPEGIVPKYSDISFRMETVIKLNKDLKNKDQIVSGQIIYIPFFKQ